jgi:hypothetical protein
MRRERADQRYLPSRNFYLKTNKGATHWTVWLDERNLLLDRGRC